MGSGIDRPHRTANYPAFEKQVTMYLRVWDALFYDMC